MQSDEKCETFKENVVKMKQSIHLLITSLPVPGTELKYPRMLKTHLLFDGEINNVLETWRTLGGVDEQNIEGTHPLFNQLLRKFGNTWGGRKQKLVMREFLFANAMWTVETIDTMLSETKRQFVGAKKKSQ